MAKTGPNQAKITEAAKETWLDSFRASGNFALSCRRIKYTQQAVRKWLKNDPEFVRKYEEAKEESIAVLEAELRRRAVHGIDKPVWYKGEQVGVVKEFSDVLLMFLLKSLRPEVYRDRVDINAQVSNQSLADIMLQGAQQLKEVEAKTVDEKQLPEPIDPAGDDS